MAHFSSCPHPAPTFISVSESFPAINRFELKSINVLFTTEYEGITKNGGVGTYYRNFAIRMKQEDRYNILLTRASAQQPEGAPDEFGINTVFYVDNVAEHLLLADIHRALLKSVRHDPLQHLLIGGLLFCQAIQKQFPEASVYIDCHEMLGIGYHILHAKKAGILGNNCLVGVTIHSGHEWVYEANEKYVNEHLDYLWRVLDYEQSTFESADIAYFPSFYLKDTVATYGWETAHAINLPYFIPILPAPSSTADTERLLSADTPALEQPEYSQKQDRAIRIIFFGRLEERKGLCLFLDGLLSLSPELQERIAVTFLGRVVPLYSAELQHLDSRQYITEKLAGSVISYEVISDFFSSKAINYIRSIDNPIVCLTSPQDNFPNTGLEMGQIPAALVVSDTGGFRETLKLVQRREGLYWFTPKDVESFTVQLTAAIHNCPEHPAVAGNDRLHSINKELMRQRVESIDSAFQKSPRQHDTPLITVAVLCRNHGQQLPNCLKAIQQQSYSALQVLVIDDCSSQADSISCFAQAEKAYPQFTFIRLAKSRGSGWLRNHVMEHATGAYVITIEPAVRLYAYAVREFVQAAGSSNATIVSCAEIRRYPEKKLISFPGGALPALLKENVLAGEACLISAEFIRKYGYIEDTTIDTKAWEIISAARATAATMVYYPYPLYELHRLDSQIETEHETQKRQYMVSRYLAQIPPSHWSSRQINMLLLAVNQLQSLPEKIGGLTSTHEQELENMKAAQQRLMNELADLNKQCEHARDHISAMQDSKFWKLRKVWVRLKERITR